MANFTPSCPPPASVEPVTLGDIAVAATKARSASSARCALRAEHQVRQRRIRAGVVLGCCLGLAACRGETPQRAQISAVELVPGPALEVEQRLQLSATMLQALASGVPLRLGYEAQCGAQWQAVEVLDLRYAPLRRTYELQQNGAVRRFARRGSLLAALDRVRLNLTSAPPAGCEGRLQMALDLTALPTPLRFPALLQPAEWRLVSPQATWRSARN